VQKPPLNYEPKTVPTDEQAKWLAETWADPIHFVAWDCGTGKTKFLIDTAAAQFEAGMIDALVVIAPDGVHANFVLVELMKHLPDRLREKTESYIFNSKGSTTKREQQNMNALLARKGFVIIAMPYDGLTTKAGTTFLRNFVETRRKRFLIAADESHRIKTESAERTKRAVAVSSYASAKRTLSGTPMTNAPWDYYSQVFFLDRGFWVRNGIPNFEAFKVRFGVWDKGLHANVHEGLANSVKMRTRKGRSMCADPECPARLKGCSDAMHRDMNYQVPGFFMRPDGKVLREYPVLDKYRDLEVLKDMLAPILSRVTKDSLGLPEKMPARPHYFTMGPENRKAYDALAEQSIAFIEGNMVSPRLAITLMLRLQQVAAGFVPLDVDLSSMMLEDPVHVFKDNGRLHQLEELVDGSSAPIIIWSHYRRCLDMICGMLQDNGRSFVRYDGTTAPDKRPGIIKAYSAGDIEFFVSNQQVGGEGVDLTASSSTIYYTNSHKLSERLQTEDRTHRKGQHRSCDYTDIIAADTVETPLVTGLQAKLDTASVITGDKLRELIRQ
jgi:hypothetical protein